MRRLVLCVMLTTLCFACASDDGEGRRDQSGTGSSDAGGGGGHTSDAACGPMDGGALPDAGEFPDGGVEPDAGGFPDGGVEPDAGWDPFPDAGGEPDAGGHW